MCEEISYISTSCGAFIEFLYCKNLHAVVVKLLAGHPHTRLDELLPDALLRAQPALGDPLRVTVPVPSSSDADAHAA